jgi:hypothetical protein
VSTEFTSIEEAVEELHVSVDIVLTQDDIDYEKLRLPPGVSMSQDRGGFEYEHTFNLSDVSPIYVGDPATTIDDVTIDGEINLNYEMIFNLDIGWFNLGVEFRNIVESYTDLNVTVPIHLFTIPFVPIPVAPLVVITPVIYINIGLDGEIDAELTVGVTIDQTGENRLESGFEYDNGTWHSIKNSPVFDLEPKIPVLNLGGTIKPYLGPQLELIFNGCAGVYGSLYGYLELEADINDDPWWCLYGGFEGIIGAQLKILSFDLGDPVEWTIFNPNRKLLCCADGPFGDINHAPIISSLTADPPSIDINQTTSITCTASDEDVGDTLTYTWTKNGGTFEGSTSGPTITWRAPSTPGNYTVSCEVSDGEASDNDQVVINVNDPGTSYPVHNLTKGTYYNTIQAALDDANSNNTIEVSDGTYDESITFPSNKKIILQSANGPSSTIIRGNDGSSTVTLESSLEGTTLEGFNITHLSTNEGGGTYIYSGYLIINNCTISGNNSSYIYGGGGICNFYGNLTITGSTISNNSTNNYGHGGGIYNSDGNLTVTGSTISDNTGSDGGGICNWSGNLTITGSTISDNTGSDDGSGGGIFNNDGTITISTSIISGNTVGYDGGGIYNSDGNLTITASNISNNSTNIYSGGGIGNFYGNLTITGSTISDNSANKGGGIYLYYSSGTITIGGSGNTDTGNFNEFTNNYKTGSPPSPDQHICEFNGDCHEDYPYNYFTPDNNGTYALRDIGPAGGYIFYDKGYYSDGWRYLEAAPASTEWTDKEWGSYGTNIGGTEMDIGSGQSNTTKIATWLNSHSETGKAAQLCDALVYGSYSDWFLPSIYELKLMHTNLKVYGVGGFSDSTYWSSSEYITVYADEAYHLQFYWGTSGWTGKNNTYRVRAARAF